MAPKSLGLEIMVDGLPRYSGWFTCSFVHNFKGMGEIRTVKITLLRSMDLPPNSDTDGQCMPLA
jgi:hypothetical protein